MARRIRAGGAPERSGELTGGGRRASGGKSLNTRIKSVGVGWGKARMRNGAIKKDLTGIGDFFPEIGVSADGTAFIHGSPLVFLKILIGHGQPHPQESVRIPA